MRLVVQRVRNASVSLAKNSHVTGKIGRGLFVLIGVTHKDSAKDAELLAEKLLKLRIMSDDNGKMNLSVTDTKGGLLVVSQFTLYADTTSGNRPSFINAAEPAKAEEIYEHFIAKLKESGLSVESGVFGEHMIINAELDGPVTITI